jgi:hypothetical protein
MIRNATLCTALLVAFPAPAQDSPPPDDATQPAVIGSGTNPEDFDLARKKVVECEGEKFLFSWGAGSRPTKVTLCSKKDATPEDLVKMLDDAATKLEGTVSIAEDRRIAIVQQIRAKIAEIKSAAAVASPPAAAVQAPPDLPRAAAVNPAPVAAPPPYSAVPVLAPKPVTVAARPQLPAKPRLTFECYTPGDIGSGGPCTIIGRDTRLTIKADEPLAEGTALRFRRYGETRAEIALNSMRKGQSVRLVMPQKVCRGVVEAEVEIQVTRSGNTIDSRGPFLLRC